jgi:UPF0755 protein
MYLTLIFILGLVSSFLYANYIINQKINFDKPVKVNIPKGSGTNRIAEILFQEKIAEPKSLFSIYLKYLSFVDKRYLKAGVYLFPAKLTVSEVIESIFSGKYLYIAKVTFPEGIGYKQFASILKSSALIDSVKFVELATSDSLLKSRGIPSNSVDGYLLPETYEFYIESKAKDVLDKLLDYHKKMFDRINSIATNNAKLTKHETLTLASIVEAETPDDDERSRVAGLYLNRISKKMLLQADPTVAYFLNGKKRLLYDDLKIDNLYNTYKYYGLPPGPINNPGTKSIRAALNPESHNYIYMVSIGDGSFRHNFSENYATHNTYVREYRRRIKSQQ